MKMLALIIACMFSLAGCSGGEQSSTETTSNTPADSAEAVYSNGRIYTANEAHPWVEAVAIKDGRLMVVGSNDDVAAVTSDATNVVNLEGAFVMPGIGDSHVHPSMFGPKRAFCVLPGSYEEADDEMTVAALEECIANYPDDREWFIAQGFGRDGMSPETLTREVLDRLIPDKPAYIEDGSGHNAWFNTLAMERAGVNRDTPDTPGGHFSRTADGDLAGSAFEEMLNYFDAVRPPFDTETNKIAFTRFLSDALAQGITAVGDGYVFEEHLEAWQDLKQENQLNQHVVLYIAGNFSDDNLTPVESLDEWWDTYDLPGHKAVKMGMGGAIESVTEALVDGYADPENVFTTIVAAEAHAEYIRQLDAAGYQVKTHAVGDGTVRATLDGYEETIRANGNNHLRHHIDHCSLVHPDDFQRFVDLDVSCTIWPMLQVPLPYNTEYIASFVKPETFDRIYAWRDMVDSGVRMVHHTDAPAAMLWPWWGMETLITRGLPGKPEYGTLGPGQGLTIEEAIKIYTIDTMWSLRLEDETGSIEEGKWADMIVLNHNLLEIPATEVRNTEVQKTIFKGEVVYERGD